MSQRFEYRMDGAHMEPRHRLPEDQSGLQKLLRRTNGETFKAMGAARYAAGFEPTLHWDLIDAPRAWKKPRLVFVNSMSDLFQEDVPEEFVQRAFQTMEACPQHTFQILTKQSERLRDLGARLRWPANVWMGVSVEDARVMHRVVDLACCARCGSIPFM